MATASQQRYGQVHMQNPNHVNCLILSYHQPAPLGHKWFLAIESSCALNTIAIFHQLHYFISLRSWISIGSCLSESDRDATGHIYLHVTLYLRTEWCHKYLTLSWLKIINLVMDIIKFKHNIDIIKSIARTTYWQILNMTYGRGGEGRI